MSEVDRAGDGDFHERLEHLGLGRKHPCAKCVAILDQRLALAIAEREDESAHEAFASAEDFAAACVREAARVRSAKFRERRRAAEASRDRSESHRELANGIPRGQKVQAGGAP